MSLSNISVSAYDAGATGYNSPQNLTLPNFQLESQLLHAALSPCAGARILDLAGGSGLHARSALDLGAASVDIIDTSPGMLAVAMDAERKLGREGAVRCFEGDCAGDLSVLPLLGEGAYDVVMANWLFSYADTHEVLERMVANVARYLKPGGRFIAARDGDLRSPVYADGKYGATRKWMEEVHGGVKYKVLIHCEPQIETEGMALDVLTSGSTEVLEKIGLRDVAVVPYDKAEVVRNDPEFWKPFLERPIIAVMVGVKET